MRSTPGTLVEFLFPRSGEVIEELNRDAQTMLKIKERYRRELLSTPDVTYPIPFTELIYGGECGFDNSGLSVYLVNHHPSQRFIASVFFFFSNPGDKVHRIPVGPMHYEIDPGEVKYLGCTVWGSNHTERIEVTWTILTEQED